MSLCWYGGDSVLACQGHMAPVETLTKDQIRTHMARTEPKPLAKNGLHHLHHITSHDYPMAGGDPTPSAEDDILCPNQGVPHGDV